MTRGGTGRQGMDEETHGHDEPNGAETATAPILRENGTPPDRIARARRALAPAEASLRAAGFYAYAAFDDQHRWTVSADDEAGHVDVRLGDDGFAIELWGTSPGLYAEEENDFRRRALERLARIVLPNVARGMLEPHQSARWDEVEGGIELRIRYELPFTRADDIGAFARAALPELQEVLARVERQVAS